MGDLQVVAAALGERQADTAHLQVGLKLERDLPHVPLLRELVCNEKDLPAFEFITNAAAVGVRL